MKVLRMQKMEHEQAKSVFKKTVVNMVDESVVGKFVCVVDFGGFVCSGIGETESEAIENARLKTA